VWNPFRSQHPKWKELASHELILGSLIRLRAALNEASVSWERPISILNRQVLFTFETADYVHFHFGPARSHSHQGRCCEDVEEAGRHEFCARINQFEVFLSRAQAALICENNRLRLALTEDSLRSVDKLPEFARTAYLHELLKRNRLLDFRPGRFSEIHSLEGEGENTPFSITVLAEFYPLVLNLDERQAYFPLEIGLMVERVGLPVDSSKDDQNDVMQQMILAFHGKLKALYDAAPVAPTSNLENTAINLALLPENLAKQLWERLEPRLAAMQQIGKRSVDSGSANHTSLAVGRLALIPELRRLTVRGQSPVILTPQQLKVFETLIRLNIEGVTEPTAQAVLRRCGIGQRSSNWRISDLFQSRPGLWGSVISSGSARGTIRLITD
jgi:hypothetical protein